MDHCHRCRFGLFHHTKVAGVLALYVVLVVVQSIREEKVLLNLTTSRSCLRRCPSHSPEPAGNYSVIRQTAYSSSDGCRGQSRRKQGQLGLADRGSDGQHHKQRNKNLTTSRSCLRYCLSRCPESQPIIHLQGMICSILIFRWLLSRSYWKEIGASQPRGCCCRQEMGWTSVAAPQAA